MSNTTISLAQVLKLVGNLDDGQGAQTPRERFRQFLNENVREVGQVRDYVEECLRTAGDQYSRALQDLVNHIGHFLGFAVAFGRYQGIQGQLGFDGNWTSTVGFHIVVEVKTTEVYAIRTATLVGYVDGLISEKRIPSWDSALGLYVVGRPDPNIRQLEHSIVAEHRTHQLRVVSVESLLSLAEMMHDYDVRHEDILSVLRPSGPNVDAVVSLMSRLVAGQRPPQPPDAPSSSVETTTGTAEEEPGMVASNDATGYWLTSAAADEEQTAEEVIQSLVGTAHVYGFGDRTAGRRSLKPGDWMCFYAKGTGIVAHAQVASAPEDKPDPRIHHSEKWHWVFRLTKVQVYLDTPVVLDAEIRGQLSAFHGRDPNATWSWFVQATQRLNENDFKVLTQQ